MYLQNNNFNTHNKQILYLYMEYIQYITFLDGKYNTNMHLLRKYLGVPIAQR